MSCWMAAIAVKSMAAVAPSSSLRRPMRRPEEKNQPTRTGAASGFSLADATKPSGGSHSAGRSLPVTQCSQSVAAARGSSSDRDGSSGRAGRCTAIVLPICPSRSAYSMFCPGTANRSSAARNSCQVRARVTRSNAVTSSLGRCPIQRSATTRRLPRSAGRSEMTGPYAVSRISIVRSRAPRTRSSSRRVLISPAGRPVTS